MEPVAIQSAPSARNGQASPGGVSAGRGIRGSVEGRPVDLALLALALLAACAIVQSLAMLLFIPLLTRVRDVLESPPHRPNRRPGRHRHPSEAARGLSHLRCWLRRAVSSAGVSASE